MTAPSKALGLKSAPQPTGVPAIPSRPSSGSRRSPSAPRSATPTDVINARRSMCPTEPAVAVEAWGATARQRRSVRPSAFSRSTTSLTLWV